MDKSANPFSHFPLVDVPEQQATPQDILGHTLEGVEYVVPLMVRPEDMTARHLAQSTWRVHEMIGGDLAYARWAMNNRTKFYTSLLARMLPQASSPVMQDQNEVRFRLAVPVKALDITDVEDLRNQDLNSTTDPHA